MKIGQAAPDFKLKDKDGKTFALKDFKGSQVVIYFYPKDDTPGCTIQAKGYSKALAKFEKLGVIVLGISGGDEKTKQKFCTKHKLKVTLLSDPDFSVAKKFGAFGDKVFMGKKFKGIFRNTYVLDKTLKVQQILEKVDPEADVETVLGVLQAKKPSALARTAAKTVAKPVTKTVKSKAAKVAAKKPVAKKTDLKKKSTPAVTKLAVKKTSKKLTKAPTKKVAKKKAPAMKKAAIRKSSKSMR